MKNIKKYIKTLEELGFEEINKVYVTTINETKIMVDIRFNEEIIEMRGKKRISNGEIVCCNYYITFKELEEFRLDYSVIIEHIIDKIECDIDNFIKENMDNNIWYWQEEKTQKVYIRKEFVIWSD